MRVRNADPRPCTHALANCGCPSGGVAAEMQAIEKLVDIFAQQMKLKLKQKLLTEDRSGWDDPNWTPRQIADALVVHLPRGDVVDVANFCAFLWNRGDDAAHEAMDEVAGPLLQPDPIPMLLSCPSCGARHIDTDDWLDTPHHTHLCSLCACRWTPAAVPTVGVERLYLHEKLVEQVAS